MMNSRRAVIGSENGRSIVWMMLSALALACTGSLAQMHPPMTIQSGSNQVGSGGVLSNKDIKQQIVAPLQATLSNHLLNAVPQLTQGVPVSVNHHVSNIKMGNTKRTDINHVHQNIAPKVRDSVYHGPTGGHDSHHSTPSGYRSIGERHLSRHRELGPTREQQMIKEKLLELLDKATTGVNPNEAEHNKHKLEDALRLLNPEKIPADLLRGLLDDAADGHIDNNNYLDMLHDLPPEDFIAPAETLVDDEPYFEQPPVPAPEPELVPEELDMPPPESDVPDFVIEDETIPREVVPAYEEKSLFEQIREELDDRLNRITDLLYFRPEFMNQLLQLDECTQLTPLEAEFKRMILCNSDEQFCNRPACPQPLMAHPVMDFSGPEVADEDLDLPPPIVASSAAALHQSGMMNPPRPTHQRQRSTNFKVYEYNHSSQDGVPVVRSGLNSNNNGRIQQRFQSNGLQQQRLDQQQIRANPPPPHRYQSTVALPMMLARSANLNMMARGPLPVQQPAVSSNMGLGADLHNDNRHQYGQQQHQQQQQQVNQARNMMSRNNNNVQQTNGGFELRKNPNFSMPARSTG